MPPTIRSLPTSVAGATVRSSTNDPAAATLRVEAWNDPIVECIGFDPLSSYVELFWLPVLGPSATFLYRRLAWGILDQPDGFDLDAEDLACSLGLGGSGGKHSPFHRAILRCGRYGLVRHRSNDILAVRRRVAPLSDHHLQRLPPALRRRHRQWQNDRHSSVVETIRHRARQLALDLMAAEPDPAVVERLLLRWGIHPALAYEVAGWARRHVAEAGALAALAPIMSGPFDDPPPPGRQL